jgi:hypothetical protein
VRQYGRVNAAQWQSWESAGPVLTSETVGQRRPALVPAAVAGLAAAVLGVGAGLLWRVVAPHVAIVKVEQGFLYADAQPEQAVAADGWFALLGLVAGVLVALVAWFVLRRRRGVAVLVGLVLGSLVGAWLGWWLGVQLETAHFEALAAATPIGSQLDAPLSVQVTNLNPDQLSPFGSERPWIKVTGVIVAQALGAAFVYTTLAAFATDPRLRVDTRTPESIGAAWGFPTAPDQPGPAASPWLSSGPEAPPDQTGSPARP